MKKRTRAVFSLKIVLAIACACMRLTAAAENCSTCTSNESNSTTTPGPTGADDRRTATVELRKWFYYRSTYDFYVYASISMFVFLVSGVGVICTLGRCCCESARGGNDLDGETMFHGLFNENFE